MRSALERPLTALADLPNDERTRTSRFFMHDDQPEQFKMRYEMAGGWPARGLLVHTFEPGTSSQAMERSKSELSDQGKLVYGPDIVVNSKVWVLAKAFEPEE